MKVRTGQAPDQLPRQVVEERFRALFDDPAFDAERPAIERLQAIVWQAYAGNHKSPRTSKAGPGYADPDYDLSDEWRRTRERLRVAEQLQRDAGARRRVLVVCGSPRNDGSCPGEMSKTWRLARLAEETLAGDGVDVDFLDLSLVTSEYGRQIHPCKGCVSTAEPLCHWPCSCYPNHATGQVNDWMAEIYERWVAAHGVILLTPVHWYQSPSVLKLMIDRLVCADGGNPDPSSTHGKEAAEAKQLELKGWDYPKHLAGRVYGLVVHGDVAGIEGTRRALSDWLDWMGLVDAGFQARLDRYIGYYGSYAGSHDALDDDEAVQEETRNVARAVAAAMAERRAGRLEPPDAALSRPRPK